ncbi:MAG: hypothetical protein KF735_02100 [Chelatococcus sp.]|uniref:hypothetical protein n=1 Tax=Chelatococcus sp. TaxID=1953771 RepID=UPI0025C43C6C|nr:hypothetical protein [Chelatococcus sp.]MBX3536404.1 hypothetical protein [Chelatococcus sp.]
MSDHSTNVPLTAAQRRVLGYLERFSWTSLQEIGQAHALQPDDVDAVPSLIERGLVEHSGRLSMPTVRITDAGRAALWDKDGR